MPDCLFCKIIDGTIPSEKIFENEEFLAFKDINPQSPVHILIIPKKHLAKLSDCGNDEKEILSGLLLTANNVAKEIGIAESGYRVAINSGDDGGQLVHHLHLHLMGGGKLDGRMA
ncbi:MAG: histidine triad nucleotide-binding protein [Proteobacteria bacterium]|nr:histidine triad nucleotide-binding protein [Pseudomonadota bacterium]